MHQIARITIALVFLAALAASGALVSTSGPPDEPRLATDADGGTTDPPPDDPDSRPAPTLPLPPPSPASLTTLLVVDVRGRALASR